MQVFRRFRHSLLFGGLLYLISCYSLNVFGLSCQWSSSVPVFMLSRSLSKIILVHRASVVLATRSDQFRLNVVTLTMASSVLMCILCCLVSCHAVVFTQLSRQFVIQKQLFQLVLMFSHRKLLGENTLTSFLFRLIVIL